MLGQSQSLPVQPRGHQRAGRRQRHPLARCHEHAELGRRSDRAQVTFAQEGPRPLRLRPFADLEGKALLGTITEHRIFFRESGRPMRSLDRRVHEARPKPQSISIDTCRPPLNGCITKRSGEHAARGQVAPLTPNLLRRWINPHRLCGWGFHHRLRRHRRDVPFGDFTLFDHLAVFHHG